jgi:O-glycosyl hydrolase
MKHAGGRPTKYNPSMSGKISEYFREAIPQNMKIPTVEGLCLKLGISKDTIYRWAKESKEFSDALEQVLVLQKEYLTEIGIFGGKEINSNIVMLFLKANHGMVETTRQELTGKDGQELNISVTRYDPDKSTT